eukprot:1339981-Pyramimonas_sp.AAC.1
MQVPLVGLAPCYCIGESVPAQTVSLALGLQQQWLPHDTSSHCIQNRALARDILTMYVRIALSRGTSSQCFQTVRPRRSGITL